MLDSWIWDSKNIHTEKKRMNKTIVKNYQFTVNIYISTVPCLEIITSTVLFNVRKTLILLKTVKTTLRDDCNSHGAIWFSIR